VDCIGDYDCFNGGGGGGGFEGGGGGGSEGLTSCYSSFCYGYGAGGGGGGGSSWVVKTAKNVKMIQGRAGSSDGNGVVVVSW
jgi:hypothetical protein